MTMLELPILGKIVDGLIIIITGAVLFMIRKIFKHADRLSEHDTMLALCEQRDKQREIHRQEDKRLRDDQRKEMLGKIDSHHRVVMKKLDSLG